MGSLNNVVTVTKMDFEVFYEKMNFASLQARGDLLVHVKLWIIFV